MSQLQASFLLHHKRYQESSLLLDVFTQSEGRISLIAKGVKQKNSSYLGVLRPFIPLNIAYSGRQELKLLSYVEGGNSEFTLLGISTYCGFYLNELLRCFLPLNEAYPDIFILYFACLQQLQDAEKIQVSLRNFEIQLISILGYGIDLTHDFVTHQPVKEELIYRYNGEQGVTVDDQGSIHGETLVAMQQSLLSGERQLNEAKWLMRQMIDFYLQGKELKSRALISKYIQKTSCKNR